MEARPEQAHDALVQTENLWDKAPAWRSLVVTASLLTTVALALPLIPQPETKPSVTVAAPKPHANAPVMQTATLPKPVAAAPAPAEPAPLLPAPKTMHHAAIPQPMPAQPVPVQPAPAQLASAMPEPQVQPQTQSTACAIVGPVTPQPRGYGRVVSFVDHATAMALIQMTQRRAGGQIDPDYVDNLRVAVQVGNGMTRTVLVPKTMQVHIGDTIAWQEGYRNMNLPCNYVPSLITSDLSPQNTTQSTPPVPQQ